MLLTSRKVAYSLNKAPVRVASEVCVEHPRTMPIKECFSALSYAHSGTITHTPDGRPIWPAGFSGSLSYSGNWTACMLTQGNRLVGCDLESSDNMTIPLSNHILRDSELQRCPLAEHHSTSRLKMATLFFSAKESAGKALCQNFCRRLEFQELEIYPSRCRNKFLVAHVASGSLNPSRIPGVGYFAWITPQVVATAFLSPEINYAS
ncbi:4'-phosphopantetheinyl transferase superfamily protein [Salinisphaera hydrothermalis]|uniref:4'-phosphopantetheinyl transferase superfamily protein n=1 Tax=Salinisphaera hydrothermalis TaxID=563188 RepID=UPI0033421030